MAVSKDQIQRELEEVRKDLHVFKEARDVFQRRSVELENEPERQDRFVGWAVTQVVLNGLLLGAVKCEGLIEDYERALEKGELAPVISLVTNKEKINDKQR